MGNNLEMTLMRVFKYITLCLLGLVMLQCGNDGQTKHYIYITNAEWSSTASNTILIAKDEYDIVEGKTSGCGNEAVVESPRLPQYELFLVDTAGNQMKQLTSSARLSSQAKFKWSPQGNRVLLWDNGYSLLKIIDTAGIVTRFDSVVYVSDAGWSTDGSSIACSAIKGAGASPRLYRINTSAGNVSPLFTSLQTGAVAWSSKNIIAFAAFDSAITRLMTIQPDGNGLQTIDSAVGIYNVRWSPDGNTLVYSRKTQTSTDIVFYQALTDQQQLLLQYTDDTQVISLRYSPDGTMLSYYLYAGTDQFDLYAINIDGSNARPVATLSTDGSWSPDSKSMAYVYYNKVYAKRVQ